MCVSIYTYNPLVYQTAKKYLTKDIIDIVTLTRTRQLVQTTYLNAEEIHDAVCRANQSATGRMGETVERIKASPEKKPLRVWKSMCRTGRQPMGLP